MPKSILNRLPLLILLSLLIALVVFLLWPVEQTAQKKHERIVSVKTIKVQRAEFKDVIQSLGTTRANEQVEITSKYSDLVDEIFFSDGQVVKKGDVLVRLSSLEALAKVNELTANLAESVAQLSRFQDLFEKKATSKSLVEQQEAKTKAIEAQLLSAQSKLNYLTITAPFDGMLGFRQISIGSFINSGDVITSLDDLSIIKADFSLPERFFTTVKLGQVIKASNAAYQNQVFIGEITSIDSRIDPITRTVKVRAEITNKSYQLRPGMLLNVIIERQIDTVLQLPESAIIPVEDKHFVFVVTGKIAQRIAVKVGRRQPGIIEVISGVTEGTEVVVEGALKLRDGSQINVLEDTSEQSL